MAEINRQIVKDALEQDWGGYVQRYEALSPGEQTAFLKRQGYARLGDLLGHVIAWWEEGLEAVKRILNEPDFQSPEYNVDAFNARAVARFQSLSDLAIIQKFESLRRAWLDLIQEIPEDAFHHSRLGDRLSMELIGHYQEHRLNS